MALTWQMTCISLTFLETNVLCSELGFVYHSFSLEFLGIQHIWCFRWYLNQGEEPSVLVSAGTVLCFVFRMRIVLMHWCFAEQYLLWIKDFTGFHVLPARSCRRSWKGAWPRQVTQTGQRVSHSGHHAQYYKLGEAGCCSWMIWASVSGVVSNCASLSWVSFLSPFILSPFSFLWF